MKIIFSLIAASALFISALSATAQTVCAPRDRAVAQLENQFKEMVSWRGIAANGTQMIELFVSEAGSWTMLASQPNGKSCVVGNGDGWQGVTVLAGDPA